MSNKYYKANVLQRLSAGYINVARVEYNELTEQFILHVISPGQAAEIHNGDIFISFLTQHQLEEYLND